MSEEFLEHGKKLGTVSWEALWGVPITRISASIVQGMGGGGSEIIADCFGTDVLDILKIRSLGYFNSVSYYNSFSVDLRDC